MQSGIQRTIKSEDNIVFIRDGWGNATPGNYWTKGDYLWEAYIDGELIGSKKFYVEDVGLVTANGNPYFSIESLKFYSGPDNDVEDGKRKYVTTFSKSQTPYVWLELKIKNKTPKDWFCELFHTFYDDCGGVKGKTDSFRYIEKGKEGYIYTFTAGWGSNTPGSWKDKDYRLNIVFMDTLVASVNFDFDENEVEGVFDLTSNVVAGEKKTVTAGPTAPVETLEDVMKQLDELIGLSQVKDNIRDHVKYLDFIKYRTEKGFTIPKRRLYTAYLQATPVLARPQWLLCLERFTIKWDFSLKDRSLKLTAMTLWVSTSGRLLLK